MRLAIIAEKPSLLKACIPHIAAHFPDVDYCDVAVAYPIFGWFVGNRRFHFPHGLRWKDFPYIGMTKYREITPMESAARIGVKALLGSDRPATDEDYIHRITSADHIIVLMDPDDRGSHLALRFLSDCGLSVACDRVFAPELTGLTHGQIAEAVSRTELGTDRLRTRAKSCEIRRYFDYNYILNSNAVFNATHEYGRAKIPSKYGLQTLYAVREAGRSGLELSDGKLCGLMADWKGTGKYPMSSDGLGSPTSRMDIIEDLVRSGYITRIKVEGEKLQRIEMAEAGLKFLECLHPACQDADLPFRLQLWSRLPFDEAKPKIDRYIRTFFGKQKVFWEKRRDAA